MSCLPLCRSALAALLSMVSIWPAVSHGATVTYNATVFLDQSVLQPSQAGGLGDQNLGLQTFGHQVTLSAGDILTGTIMFDHPLFFTFAPSYDGQATYVGLGFEANSASVGTHWTSVASPVGLTGVAPGSSSPTGGGPPEADMYWYSGTSGTSFTGIDYTITLTSVLRFDVSDPPQPGSAPFFLGYLILEADTVIVGTPEPSSLFLLVGAGTIMGWYLAKHPASS